MATTNSAPARKINRAEQQEAKMAQQVMDLFHVKSVHVMYVSNYHQLPEWEKREVCDLYRNITLCKVPARNGKGMWFFLSRGERL